MPNKTIKLRVAEARHRDAGRGIARVSTEVMQKLNLTSGDIIQIDGKGTATAVVWPGYPNDPNDAIRIDGSVRNNAGAGIGDKVEVKKVNAQKAKKIAIAPTEEINLRISSDGVRKILEGRPISKGQKIRVEFFGRAINYKVVQTDPAGTVIADSNTKIQINDKPVEEVEEVPQVTYEDIGGLEKELRKVREMIELPMKKPELFQRLGIEPPKGVLLHGPPGTGKTLIAKAVANETDAHFISLGGPEIMSKYYGESEKQLRELFEEAKENSPSIIFIDELDSIAPKREEVSGEVERRVVAQLLSLMDGLEARGEVVVIATTNQINLIDPALRRPGRFDREIEIGVPDRDGRREIFEVHTRSMPLAENINLDEFADRTYGFVGADIESLTKESAMNALRRILPEIDIDADEIPQKVIDELEVEKKDFEQAHKEIEPSAMREVFVEIPDITWKDVGGLEEIKTQLREAVEWPMTYPEAFQKIDTQPPRGIVLHGPPGTGKTLLAKAVANESDANFISVKGPELLSKWVGESEKAVRETFRKAKQSAPTIIFFDEIDSITPRRGGMSGDSQVTERVISQMLTELDGLEERGEVVVIAATNRPDLIDPALLRQGRLEKHIEVGPPDQEARKEIFKVHTQNKPTAKNIDTEKLAKKTDGYVGSDIEGVCKEASMIALREKVKQGMTREEAKKAIQNIKITKNHFEQALEKVRSSKDRGEIEQYQKISKDFQAKREEKIEEPSII
ncbi:ATPase of the AAA+ class CDC48 family [Methanonatronarchaeum thermophilum]|uniref:ATPase of the AAA+ class CDC48 family n=1 Tax=Methanonatronarchaeum thermophilum TaxID=1927129 RepID=A0A1Y3GCS8_9EURY|nr:CDC48 family AAA ATPase [Methanonatronarchaeum thermophilum]OUJ19199.1 ATPase of the AAA+ class CDC48 family [Methanonatronarchaeum thermophilum]